MNYNDIKLDDKLIEAGRKHYENMSDSQWKLGDFIHEVCEEHLHYGDDAALIRKHIVEEFIKGWVLNNGGAYNVGTLMNLERTSRHWPPEKREQFTDQLDYSHFRVAGGNRDAIEQAYRKQWSVRSLEDHMSEIAERDPFWLRMGRKLRGDLTRILGNQKLPADKRELFDGALKLIKKAVKK